MFCLKSPSGILITSLLLMQVQVSIAQNKVVVIPMAGDDVAIAQQYEVYDDRSPASLGTANACVSAVYRTPAQAVQVYASYRSMVLLPTGASFYRLFFEYSKNGGSYLQAVPNSYAGGASNTYVQVNNVTVLELDPLSDYQFRLKLNTLPFDAGDVNCRVALTFSYKLANGKTIVE